MFSRPIFRAAPQLTETLLLFGMTVVRPDVIFNYLLASYAVGRSPQLLKTFVSGLALLSKSPPGTQAIFTSEKEVLSSRSYVIFCKHFPYS